LVIGGGISGMTAALTLADQGFPVHLVEKDPLLGGQLRQLYVPLNDQDPQEVLESILKQVQTHPLITIHTNTRTLGTKGFKGNFSSQISTNGGKPESIRHGATILATGGQEYRGPEYGYGSDPRIITQQELESRLSQNAGLFSNQSGGSLVMIQCVGPAEKYCSRICCTTALKNALAIKKMDPSIEISIIYKDIRVYGLHEQLYTQVRDQGVFFFRYDDNHKPEVTITQTELPAEVTNNVNGNPQVRLWDEPLKRQVNLSPDLVVLSMPVIPQDDMKNLANLFKVSTDADGFFLEAHVKLRPVDFSTEGIYMAGMAHYPKLIEESVIQAQAAASRAAIVLSQDYFQAGGSIAVVTQEKCTGCLTCVRVCPFDVPVIQADVLGVGDLMGAAYIEPAICQGCGICVAECPAQAIDLMNYTDSQLKAKVSALLQSKPLMLVPV